MTLSDTIIRRNRVGLDSTKTRLLNPLLKNYIDEMYLAATNVDGIHANHASPANFMHRNLMVEANIIHEVYASGVRKLLFLGPFCIYPKLMAQPVGENAFGRSMGAY